MYAALDPFQTPTSKAFARAPDFSIPGLCLLVSLPVSLLLVPLRIDELESPRRAHRNSPAHTHTMSVNIPINQVDPTAPTPQNTPLTHAPIAQGLSRPTVPDITEDNEPDEDEPEAGAQEETPDHEDAPDHEDTPDDEGAGDAEDAGASADPAADAGS